MRKSYYVYILTNKKHGTLYIGITGNLERRIYEHKMKFIDGFSKKYNLTKLVHYEETDEITIAIEREKRMKKWYRKWKIELIEKDNPQWIDLAEDWYDEIPDQVEDDSFVL